MQLYEFVHDTLGICFWTLPAAITALVMIVMGIVHGHNQKKRGKDFEKNLEKEIDEITSAAREAAGTVQR